jgi:NAD(P)-dependent dehydrogenase (short-subunit alcohol dehydrogenase family)
MTAADRNGPSARTALVTGASRGLGAAAVAQLPQPLDAAVCCAGVTTVRPFEDMAADAFDAILDVNLQGALAVTRATLPGMRAAGRGHLVYVSSLAAVLPPPGVSAYATSKAALETWASCVRQELHPFGVRVAVLRAGAFRTQMLAAPEEGPSGSAYGRMYRALDTAAPRVERLGKDPEHFARAVAKLLDTGRPRLINPTGPGSRVVPLFSALPRAVTEAVIRRAAGSR